MLSVTDAGPPPAVPAPFNMAAYVLAAGLARPDRSALQVLRPTGAEGWSYGRLIAAIRGCGTALLAAGCRPGDRVLIRLGNTPAYPLAYLGAIAAGLVAVPASPALTGAEITALAAQLSPRLILVPQARDSVLPLPDHPAATLPADPAAWEAAPPCDWHMGDADRPAYIVFTSGTSGRPLGVVHAHRAVLARQMMHTGWEGLLPTDRLLHVGAFNWTYTMGTGLIDPWTLGATALIPADGVTVAQLPPLLHQFDTTILAASPGTLRQVLRAGLPPLPRLRHALSAGEALPDALRAAWVAAIGTPVCQALGMSEVSTFLSESPDRPAPPGATGFAQPGRRLAILGPDGQPVPVGEVGGLAVHRRDPGLMLGYLDDPDTTAARMQGDWFLTGDLAVMGAEGAITYAGRNDDRMNAGGIRTSPAEVEAAFADVPGLTDCAAAEVTVKPGTTVIALFHCGTAAEDALAAHAATTLARYKQPRLFIRLDALPRNANNKLNRRALRDHPLNGQPVPPQT